ncbi:type II toxin-antitoxin system RelB/DinJ family antitoxin [Shewanella xiamenensis]|uniref:type II toxin-antitoxin system RelB/DinJ family antitoxin n=1 Tax=Shewanella xiamenensis TaxID=332186 RepID=UPI002E7B119C|nr:type II toxin-antitoxin system RelB/DinJ family antitoxin [Shewanella xiamenensis]MEE1982844.1 type II toxin-antitoxin system RelB/DinJ family antitoxin [Shewanella xiamenensis]
MTYQLEFDPRALKEWKKLGDPIRQQLNEVSMGTINIRIDDELKERSFAALEKLGVSPSEALRQTLEYVATRGALPFKLVTGKQSESGMVNGLSLDGKTCLGFRLHRNKRHR